MAVNIRVWIDYKRAAVLFAPNGMSHAGPLMRRAQMRTNREMAKYWHANMLPNKFKRGNTKYRLQPRKAPYLRIKREIASRGYAISSIVRTEQGYRVHKIRDRVIGSGDVDLVRGGRTGKMAAGYSPIVSKKTYSYVFLTVPRHIAMRPKSGKPNMADEIRAYTQAEQKRLQVVGRNALVNVLKSYKGRIRTKV